MNIKSSLLALVTISALCASSSQAATLASFSFPAGVTTNGATPTAGITVTSVTTDSSFNSFTSSTGFDSAAQISGASSFFAATSQAAAGDALVFTITADPGYSFSLDGFSFIARSTAQAPSDIGFKVGLTAYDFSLSYSNDSTITTISNQALGLTGLTSAVISIQGWNSTGTSSLQLDNLVATGTIVPEPSTTLLGAVGVLVLLRRRQR